MDEIRSGDAEFTHPYIAIDVVALTVSDRKLRVLLMRPTDSDARDTWALPGAYVQSGESLDQTVFRVLTDKAGLVECFVEQLFTFGDDPGRDDRRHTITVVHYALVEEPILRHSAGRGDGERCLASVMVPWEGVGGDPWTVIVTDDNGRQLDLTYDHRRLLGSTINRLRGKLSYSPIGYELLPTEFTMRALRSVHETLLDASLDPDSFRRRMRATGQLVATGDLEDDSGLGHRPAELFRYVGTPVESPMGRPKDVDSTVKSIIPGLTAREGGLSPPA